MSDQTETLVTAVEDVLAENGATAPEADTNTLARRIVAAAETTAADQADDVAPAGPAASESAPA